MRIDGPRWSIPIGRLVLVKNRESAPIASIVSLRHSPRVRADFLSEIHLRYVLSGVVTFKREQREQIDIYTEPFATLRRRRAARIPPRKRKRPTFQPSILKVALLSVLLRAGGSYVLLTPPPLFVARPASFGITRGELIPRRSSGREETTLSTRGIRSTERREAEPAADARGRFKSIGIDTHFREADYGRALYAKLRCGRKVRRSGA